MVERKIKINGLEANFKVWEPENKSLPADRQVLILHGWGGSSDSWQKVGERLSQKNLKIICPDLPGFGKSQAPESAWDSKEYVDFVLAFIKTVGLEKFSLLGHSFGGGIAVRFCAMYPEKIKSLVLCGAAVVRKKKATFRQNAAGFLAKNGKMFSALRGVRRIIYKIAGSRDYYQAKGIMKEIFKKIIADDLGRFASMIKQETLIIWGRDDKVLPLKDAFSLKELIRNSDVEIIEGAKHGPQFSHPFKLSEIIFKFINVN